MSRPVSPRLEDQIMFNNGVRIKWKGPNDCQPNDLNLEVKECNIVVTFSTYAFPLVRRAILDYYKDHSEFKIVYVKDTSNTNERIDKFKLTQIIGYNGNKERAEFTISFTNNKTSAVINGRLVDVYHFILNDYNDIERMIHTRHAENTTDAALQERRYPRDTRLEPPPRAWSPYITSPIHNPGPSSNSNMNNGSGPGVGNREWTPFASPVHSANHSRRGSLTSSTLSMVSDQVFEDTSESLPSLELDDPPPLQRSRVESPTSNSAQSSGNNNNTAKTKRQRRPSSRSNRPHVLIDDCTFDNSDNSVSSTQTKTEPIAIACSTKVGGSSGGLLDYAKMNGHGSYHSKSSMRNMNGHHGGIAGGGGNGVANGGKKKHHHQHSSGEVNGSAQHQKCNGGVKLGQGIRSNYDPSTTKIPRVKRPRRTASHFMFAVHLVNIQRQMKTLQQTIVALENQIKEILERPLPKPVISVDEDWLLHRIQNIIREELRMVKDDVHSSKMQVQCNRELIKRVYVEMNNKVAKDMAEINSRLSKLERREMNRSKKAAAAAYVASQSKKETQSSANHRDKE